MVADREIPAMDASRPNQARICDYLLGGRDHFAADRELAARLAAAGGVRELARVTRRFVLAATVRAVSLGIRQVADLGAGLPRTPSVHSTARSGGERVRVAYVDNDAMVLSHLSALCRDPGVTVTAADVSDPAAVLDDPAFLEVIDLAEPVLVLLGGTLSAMSAEAARAAVAAYSAAMAPQSRVAISCASWHDPQAGARMAAMYGEAGPWFNHSRADIRSFFEAGGLRPPVGTDPVMNLKCWPMATGQCGDAGILGGIAVKP